MRKSPLPSLTSHKKLVTLIILVFFFTTNCNKVTITKNLENESKTKERLQEQIKQKLLSDFRLYSDSFKTSHPQAFVSTNNNIVSRGFFRRLFRVVGADMLGALGGGLIGAVFGGPFALFGALISGTAASLNADDIWDGWQTPGNRIVNRATSVVDTFTYRHNDANEYDYIGDSHNDGLVYLHQMEVTEGSILSPSQQYDYLNSFVLNQYPGYITAPLFPENDFNTVVYGNPALNYLQAIDEVNETNQYELIYNINSISYFSEFQKNFFQILINYGMQFNDETYYLAEYFFGIENLIISSALTENEKAALLSALATGRASANFWWDVQMGNR